MNNKEHHELMGKTEDSSTVWGLLLSGNSSQNLQVEAAELGAAEDMGGEGQVDGRRRVDEEEALDAPSNEETRPAGQMVPRKQGGEGAGTGFDEREREREREREKRVRAHLFRRLRRWAGRRHVGFRRRARGRSSGELHTIRARSDKWSWRRQEPRKGKKILPNLCHAFVQPRPRTTSLIAYWSCLQ